MIRSAPVAIPSAAILGRHIRAARLRKGLTQRAIAKYFHCSLRWINEVEKGKDTAQIGKVLLLCQFLDLNMLLARSDDASDGAQSVSMVNEPGVGDGGGLSDYPDLDTIMRKY